MRDDDSEPAELLTLIARSGCEIHLLPSQQGEEFVFQRAFNDSLLCCVMALRLEGLNVDSLIYGIIIIYLKKMRLRKEQRQ